MSQVDIYRRIAEVMSDDEEVVALCRKHIERAENSSSGTQRNLDITCAQLAIHYYDEEHAISAKDFADHINEIYKDEVGFKDWNTRKASYYLTRLAKENIAEKVVVKGSSNLYYSSDNSIG